MKNTKLETFVKNLSIDETLKLTNLIKISNEELQIKMLKSRIATKKEYSFLKSFTEKELTILIRLAFNKIVKIVENGKK